MSTDKTDPVPRTTSALKSARLDPELVLELCVKFNGYDGAFKALAESGLVNPDTGRPFTKHALVFVSKKAKGYKAWRTEREKERKDTAKEFSRIARRMIATKDKQKAEAEKG